MAQTEAAALAAIEQPVLPIAAAGSPPEFRDPDDVTAAALPNVRMALVGGGVCRRAALLYAD